MTIPCYHKFDEWMNEKSDFRVHHMGIVFSYVLWSKKGHEQIYSLLQAGSYAKTALHELESLITYCTALGVTMPVIINLGFVHEILNCSGKWFIYCIPKQIFFSSFIDI